MGLLRELLSNFIGLISLFTIVFVVVMGVYFMRFFSNRIAEDERNAAKQQQRERGIKA
jgi:flagellar basal body-associated protein FliL